MPRPSPVIDPPDHSMTKGSAQATAGTALTWRHNFTEAASLNRLAGTKISEAFETAECSATDLGSAITGIALQSRSLQRHCDESTELCQLKTLVRDNCAAITAHTATAMTALQFYDRLSQQMEKVRLVTAQIGHLGEQSTAMAGDPQWAAKIAELQLLLTESAGGLTVTTANGHSNPPPLAPVKDTNPVAEVVQAAHRKAVSKPMNETGYELF